MLDGRVAVGVRRERREARHAHHDVYAALGAEPQDIFRHGASVGEKPRLRPLRRKVHQLKAPFLQERLAAGERKLRHARRRIRLDKPLPLVDFHLRPRLQHSREPRTRAEPARVVAAVRHLQDGYGRKNRRHFFGSPSSSLRRGSAFLTETSSSHSRFQIVLPVRNAFKILAS